MWSSTIATLPQWISTLADALPVGVAIARAQDGELLYANEQLTATLGADGAMAAPEAWHTFWSDVRARAVLRLAMDRDGVRDVALRHRRLDGSSVDMMASVQRVRYGAEDALLTTLVDVTPQRRIERELEDAERQAWLLRRSIRRRGSWSMCASGSRQRSS